MIKLALLIWGLVLVGVSGYIRAPYLSAAGQLWDVYASNDPRDILAFADKWLVVPYIPYAKNKITFCKSWYFLGGVGISSSVGFFERTYTGLPPHSLAYYSIPAQMIGTWSPGDSFSIIIDGVLVSTWSTSNYAMVDCGTLNIIKSIGGKIIHSGSSMTLRIAFNINSNNASPAALIFKDVYFSFRSSSQSALAAQWQALGCPFSQAPCSCASNCQVCFGTSATECARCNWGSSEFGSGCKTCPTNCNICSGLNNNECTVCKPNFHLTLNGNCESSCPLDSVAMSNGRYSVCLPPCPNGQFMMWNYTCGGSCEAPLRQVSSVPTPYCEYPCDRENGEYLQWDGTCPTSCPFSPRNESWYLFCDACEPGKWMYEDMNCRGSCKKFFDRREVGGSKFCDFPCNPLEYLYENGTCHSYCQQFYVKRQESIFNFCDSPCKAGYQLTEKGKCILLETTDSNTTGKFLPTLQVVSSAILQASSLITAGSAVSLSAAVGGRIFFNIKFLNISYSAELKEALREWLPSFISIGIAPDLPSGMSEKFPVRFVPNTFAQYDVHSSFLLNFWESFGLILLIIALCVVLLVIEVSFKWAKIQKANSLLRRFKIMTCNFLVVTLYSVYGDLVLFSLLEYRSIQFRMDLSLLSFVVSIVLIIIMIGGFLLHVKFLQKYQSLRRLNNGSDSLSKFCKKHEWIEALFRDFKDTCLELQCFSLFLIAKDLVFSFLISLFLENPILQVSIFCSNSFFLILYSIEKKPFQSTFDLALNVFFELIGLMVHISVLINAVYDDGKGESSLIIAIGKFIIAMNMVYNFAVAGIMVLQVLLSLREKWKKYRKNKAPVVRIQRELPKEAQQNNGSSIISRVNESGNDESFVQLKRQRNNFGGFSRIQRNKHHSEINFHL